MAVSHQICNTTKANARAASSAQPFCSWHQSLLRSLHPSVLDCLLELLLREEQ